MDAFEHPDSMSFRPIAPVEYAQAATKLIVTTHVYWLPKRPRLRQRTQPRGDGKELGHGLIDDVFGGFD